MLRRAVAAFVAVAVGMSACAGDDAPNGGARGDAQGGDGSGSGAALTATLQESTLFATRGALRLTVSNSGADVVEVGTVELSSPLFDPVGPETRDASLDPGGPPVAIPLRLGAARCGADGDGPDDGPDDDASAAADVVVTVDGDEQRIPLEQRPADLLAGTHDDECAVAEVLDAVELRLGDGWEAAAPRTLAGELTVTQRQPGVVAELDELRGNVIFAVERDGAAGQEQPWLTVDDDEPSADVPVRIRAARCDPHALIEYKRTFVFVAVVAIDGADPVRVDVTAEGAARTALEDLLTSCIG